MTHRSSEIVAMLESEIMEGKLTPGQRLPSEEKLCARFEASRTVIREAIQQLRGRGLLRTLKGSGSFIADPSLDNLTNAIQAYSALSSAETYLELMDLRILLESECARLAATHAGEKVIQDMERALAAMEGSKGDREAFCNADIAFHLAIAHGSRNSLYLSILRALERRSVEYAHKNLGDEPWYQFVIETHREIQKAISDGNGEEAALAMRRHLLSSRRHFIDLEASAGKK
ncbi:MAG: FadR/GntR family transcriptional regulator [Verrucomicrobiales bacterium]